MKTILIATVAFSVNTALLAHLGKEMPVASFDVAPDAMRKGMLAAIEDRIANPAAELPADMEGDALLQERIFRAVVDALKDLPDAAAPSRVTLSDAPAAPAVGFTPIRYIGKREPHIDGAYGTRILWARRGDTQLVPDATAVKMLSHRDVYERGEAATDAVAPVAPKKKVDDSDEPSQVARDMVNTMGKDALETYARTNFKVELDKRQKVGDLRAEVTSLIDRFGVA